MIGVIFFLILNCLLIFGLHKSFEGGHILHFIPRWWASTFNGFMLRLAKPLFYCRPCMASAWGWFGFMYVVTEPSDIILYPVWVLLLTGLTSILRGL